MVTRSKCVVCGVRPMTVRGRCRTCDDQITAATNRRRTEKPEKYLTYRGIVVGLFQSGTGKLRGRLLRVSDTRLPKYKTINLNEYCEGFDRTQIKSFKAACLQLAGYRG
jgi:hypothetical protein